MNLHPANDPAMAFTSPPVDLPRNHEIMIQDRLNTMTIQSMVDEIAAHPSPKRMEAVTLLNSAKELLWQEYQELRATDGK